MISFKYNIIQKKYLYNVFLSKIEDLFTFTEKSHPARSLRENIKINPIQSNLFQMKLSLNSNKTFCTTFI